MARRSTYELNLKTFGKFPTTVDAYLNGKQVLTQAKTDAPGYDRLVGGAIAEVGPLLQFGKPNILIFTTGKSGFMGEAVLTQSSCFPPGHSRSPAPGSAIDGG